MEMTFAKCESILKTLPIGFYAGRRVETSLDGKEETSFYSPMEDKIVVSYPIIAHRFKAMPKTSTCTEEEAVRAMLYHEVSHAILTPAKALENSFQINVFEDERIETVLSDFYHGVDFKKQLYDIHGGNAPKATSPETAYFNAVRFGLGTATIREKVEKILEEYSPLNGASKRYRGCPCVSDYEYAVYELWQMVKDEFKKNPEEFQPQDGEGTSPNMKSPKNMQTADGEGDEAEAEGTESEAEGTESKTEAKGTPKGGTPHKCKMSAKDLKGIIEKAFTNNLEATQGKKLAEFQKAAETIIGNFNKKNKGGCGINSYSGVFNPRAVVRKDYRFFERSMTTQGNNKFGTCHLNLIIDCSGSFYHNVPLTNGILATLSEIERKNRNFSMDVGFINTSFKLCESVRERKMEADGGNDIPDNMKEILIKMQKPNTCNYNIVLFDGDALSDGHGGDYCKLFGAFDMKQTTLITNPENERYMKPAFSAAKVVVTYNYTKELIDNIIKALTIAFG